MVRGIEGEVERWAAGDADAENIDEALGKTFNASLRLLQRVDDLARKATEAVEQSDAEREDRTERLRAEVVRRVREAREQSFAYMTESGPDLVRRITAEVRREWGLT
jgi:hypothetical protein